MGRLRVKGEVETVVVAPCQADWLINLSYRKGHRREESRKIVSPGWDILRHIPGERKVRRPQSWVIGGLSQYSRIRRCSRHKHSSRSIKKLITSLYLQHLQCLARHRIKEYLMIDFCAWWTLTLKNNFHSWLRCFSKIKSREECCSSNYMKAVEKATARSDLTRGPLKKITAV